MRKFVLILVGILLFSGPASAASDGVIAFVGEGGKIYTVNPDGSDQTQLVDLANSSTLVWSPDGSKLAFARRIGGNWELYLVNADGSELKRLTNNRRNQFNPVWSPDGSKLAFEDWGNKLGSKMNIGVYRVARGTFRRVTAKRVGVKTNPSWSPDGRWLAFTRCTGGCGIYRIKPSGKRFDRLAKKGRLPAYSPDGKILFSRTSGLWLMQGNGSGKLALTDGNVDSAYWSPDGSQIAFSRISGESKSIWFMDAEGSQKERVVEGDQIYLFGWSPSGSSLLYQQGLFDGDIFTVDLVTEESFAVAATEADESFPTWQPIP